LVAHRGITFYRGGSVGSTLENPVIKEIAAYLAKSPAQVTLRKRAEPGIKPTAGEAVPVRPVVNAPDE